MQLAILASLAIASNAAPDDPAATRMDRWVVLAESDGSSRPGPSIDERVREAARYRLNLRVLTPEEAFVEGGSEVESGLSSCAADASCLAARLRGVRAEYALLLVLRRVGDEDLIALRVVRTESGEVVHRAVRQDSALDPAASGISTIIAAAFDALGYATGGELVVRTKPDHPELVLDDGVAPRPIYAGRPTLLPASDYSVRARLADFEDASAKVTLRPAATETVELALKPASREQGLTESAWFWIGVGVAATAVGVSVAAIAAGSDRCLCAAADPSRCGSCP